MDKYFRRNVLVADDDHAMRRLIANILKSLQVENVLEAADGDEALEIFQREVLDMVILDWGMPGKTGLEVLEAIRAKPSDVPVIMVSAERTRERVIEAAEAGVTDYLVKPVERSALREKLARHCKRKVNTSLYRCRNVMNKNVITIHEDTTVNEAIVLLLKHNISGLPVVDAQNRVLGIVTEYNFIQTVTRPDLKSEPVRNVMSTHVICVDEDTIPLKVVSIMEKHRIRRIPVVRDGKLVGVISRRDILRYVEENEDVLRGFLDELKAVAENSASSSSLLTHLAVCH